MKNHLLRRLIMTVLLAGVLVFLMPDLFTASDEESSITAVLQAEQQEPGVPVYTKALDKRIEVVDTEVYLKVGRSYKDGYSGLDARGMLKTWVLSAGSFSEQSNAKQLEQRLHKDGYFAYIEKEYRLADSYEYQVSVGPMLSMEELTLVRERLQNNYNVTSIQISDWNY